LTCVLRPGIFYGQCSELCGVGHGFMPIVVKALSFPIWLDYVDDFVPILAAEGKIFYTFN